MGHLILGKRMVRFALVGGICIPVDMALIWFFRAVVGLPMLPAWICAFEPSVLLNFYGNQRFTYAEQDHLRGWDWVTRAMKALLSSLSGQVVNLSVFGVLLALHVPYLAADALGICTAFFANFLIANRFVFTPKPAYAYAEGPPLIADLDISA